MRGTVDHQEKVRSRHTAAVYSTVLIHFARNMVIRTEKLTAFATAHLWEMRRSSFAWNLNYLASCEIMWWRGEQYPDPKMRKWTKNSYKSFLLLPSPPFHPSGVAELHVKVNIVGFQSVCCAVAVNYNLLRNVALCTASCASLITFHPAKTFNCALLIRFTATHHLASSMRKRKTSPRSNDATIPFYLHLFYLSP